MNRQMRRNPSKQQLVKQIEQSKNSQNQFANALFNRINQLTQEIDFVSDIVVKDKKKNAAEKGDDLVIAIVGTVLGKRFEGGTNPNMPVRSLGSGSMIPGFEDNLVGMVEGETKTFKATFPENYGNKDLSSKEATFTVYVRGVWAKDPHQEAVEEILKEEQSEQA